MLISKVNSTHEALIDLRFYLHCPDSNEMSLLISLQLIYLHLFFLQLMADCSIDLNSVFSIRDAYVQSGTIILWGLRKSCLWIFINHKEKWHFYTSMCVRLYKISCDWGCRESSAFVKMFLYLHHFLVCRWRFYFVV